jgi:hypothetical protein
VAAVAPAERSLTLASDARLIRLDPPHVEQRADGLSSATWRATGELLQVPAGRADEQPAPLERPDSRQSARRERPVWLTIATFLLVLGGIVCSIIGLDFLLAYLVAGSPPY